MSEVVLVVDDDEDIRTFLDVTLRLAGYETIMAVDGEEGVRATIERRPDLVLMDVMMPKMDGVTAVRRLRLDSRTSQTPIIVLTAKAQADDTVAGLAAGADDYITKPFEPDELIARIESTMRRANELRTVSPLTGLPGNTRIEQELATRVAGDSTFALLYVDLNHFKAYNDQYGFLRGDEVIRSAAGVIVDAVAEHGDTSTFIGHIGGDDFVIISETSHAEAIAQAVCEGFDATAPDHYDDEHREAGGIEVKDRQGNLRKFPLVSLSVGVTSSEGRNFDHPSQPVAAATELKSFAKHENLAKSNYALDRRSTDE